MSDASEANNREEFLALTGTPYETVLQWVHQNLNPRNYLEIGTETGKTLKLSTCETVAVDPQFQITTDVVGSKPAIHLFQQGSDQFFRDRDLTNVLGGPLDFAFLDGMHLFEFLLRDFINTERHCRRNSVIAIHDCVPCDQWIAVRSLQDERRKQSRNPNWWAGDVWKIVPILREFRPDLRVHIVDAGPTGLVFVTNLNPESKVLETSYSEIVERMVDQDLSSYGFHKFVDECKLISTRELDSSVKMSRYFWL